MKKSRIVLLFSIIMTITFLLRFINPEKSIYNKKTKEIYGIITECNSKENKTTLIIKAKEKILVNIYKNYKCELGKTIYIKGKITKPQNNTLPYQFNYKKYLLSKNIKYIFIAKKIKETNNKISLKYKIKNTLIKHINNYKSKDYLNTFILANNEIDEKTKTSYINNGISHLLTISGAHIAIITTLLYKLIKKFIKNKKIIYIIIFYTLIFYLFITGYPPSLLRAVLLYTGTMIKKILNLEIKTIYLLLVVLLTLLNINPYYIYDIGYILTFTISGYLIVFKNLINKYQTYTQKTLIITLIAFMTSTPFIININFKINLISILINLIFIPIISFILYPLTLLTLFIKPLDGLLYKIIKTTETLSIKIEKIDIFNISLCHIESLYIIIYLIIEFTLLKIWE